MGMKRKNESGPVDQEGAPKDTPDIVATKDLLGKLFRVPKKELDKLIADEKIVKPTSI